MIFGHEDKVALFTSLARQNTLKHAYLFFGDSQVGKYHFARHLAYFLEYGIFAVSNKPFIDTILVELQDDKKTIGIDEIRQLRGFLFQKPFKSQRRLIIINDAHLLTVEAQSSMLKFVEDAPPHVTFIFIAGDPYVLISPLASRLLHVYFARASELEVVTFLQKHHGVAKQKAQKIAQQSFGRIGRAVALLDIVENGEQSVAEWVGDTIMELYLRDKKGNAQTIVWLLEKETMLHRYSLNQNLQRKVIEERIR